MNKQTELAAIIVIIPVFCVRDGRTSKVDCLKTKLNDDCVKTKMTTTMQKDEAQPAAFKHQKLGIYLLQ